MSHCTVCLQLHFCCKNSSWCLWFGIFFFFNWGGIVQYFLLPSTRNALKLPMQMPSVHHRTNMYVERLWNERPCHLVQSKAINSWKRDLDDSKEHLAYPKPSKAPCSCKVNVGLHWPVCGFHSPSLPLPTAATASSDFCITAHFGWSQWVFCLFVCFLFNWANCNCSVAETFILFSLVTVLPCCLIFFPCQWFYIIMIS